MFILSINTRDDSLMIDSSETKSQSFFLDNRSDEYSQVNFFFTLLLCVVHINLPEMLSFFVLLFFSYYFSRDTSSPHDQSRTPSGTKR